MVTTTIIIASGITLVGVTSYLIFRKNNPQVRIYKKHYYCSVCGSDFETSHDYCPQCAMERKTAVLLHESFIEVKENKDKLRLA